MTEDWLARRLYLFSTAFLCGYLIDPIWMALLVGSVIVALVNIICYVLIKVQNK